MFGIVMDLFFLKRSASADDGAGRKSWMEWTLPIIIVLGLLNVGVNMKQSWDDWTLANRTGGVRIQSVTAVEKAAVERGVSVLGLLNQTVSDAVEFGSLDQEKLHRIQARYRPLLGHVEIAVIGNDANPVISSHNDIVYALGGATHLSSLLAQPWKQSHAGVTVDGHKSTAFFKRTTSGPRALNIVLIVEDSAELFLNGNLTNKSVIALYDGDHHLIATVPENVDVAPGKRLEFVDLRPGLNADSAYGTWTGDGSERLILKRSIDALEEKPWTVEVGFPPDAFLSGWWRSAGANGLGIAIVLALMAFGAVGLRRERKLRQSLRTSGEALGAVVNSLPLPVLLVDSDSGTINLSNESTKDAFGVLAGEGEPAERLFTESAKCAAVLSGENNSAEPLPLLTRRGEIEFQVHCTPIGKLAGSKHVSMITLIDVSNHQTQLKTLRSAANMDALTGLGNRRFFARVEAQMVARIHHEPRPMAVLMIDIDFFKRVNDRYGHPSGDRVLVSVAQQLSATLRDHDSAFRLGGEEFCVVLWDANAVQASMVAERLRVLTQCMQVTLEGGDAISVTCSVGVTQYLAGETSLQPALERADIALYRAKDGGRNRVELNLEEAAPDPGSKAVENEDPQAVA
jgi:diguanylate cyclase (GGDEF)-like protein